MVALPCEAEEPVGDDPIEEPVEPEVYQPLFGEYMTSYNVTYTVFDSYGTDSIYYVGEQVIEDVVYKAFEHQGGLTWYGNMSRQFIRAIEDNAKVYCYHPELEKEVLIFDLTLEVGDMFDLYGLGVYSIEPVCFTVDSVYIDKKGRKNVWLTDGYHFYFQFIEGVGSTMSLFLNSLNTLLGYPVLLCSKKDDMSSYFYYDDSRDLYEIWSGAPTDEKGQPSCRLTYINVEDTTPGSLSVFPNPFSESVCIENPDEELKILTLYDQSGRQVFREEVEGFSVCIEPNLPLGAYALVIETASGKKYSKKIAQL